MAIQRLAAASVLAAAFYLPVVPAAAALPGTVAGPSAYDASATIVHQARGWRGSRDDNGYYPDYGYAAPRAQDDRYDDDPRWAAPDDRQADSYPAGRRALGLDRVADLCVTVVERERDRVNAVEGLSRDANGWSVSGSLYDGSGFSCRIGTDGQLQDVHFGRQRPAPALDSREAASAPQAPSAAQPIGGYAAPAAPAAPALGRNDDGYSATAPAQPGAASSPNLAAAPPVAPASAAQDDSAYRVAKLPPPPAIPRAEALAGARELPAQGSVAESAGQAGLAAAPAEAPTAAEATAAPAEAPAAAAEANQPASDDDSGPLPPADTSQALAVDPNQPPVAAGPAQPKDDGRYAASQARDFGPAV